MQRGVHGRLMDNSTSVREAAVELLGRFVLCRPQLAEQYYDMLIERILVWLFTSFNVYKLFLLYLVMTNSSILSMLTQRNHIVFSEADTQDNMSRIAFYGSLKSVELLTCWRITKLGI